MKLSADQWQQLSAWFDEAAALPAAERGAVLARARAQAPELAERLQRMLAELPADDATLIAPVDAAPAFQAQLAQALAPDAEAPPVAAGDRYGAWRLVRLLGEGGMGKVWLAERADGLYEGQAAVKLLRGDVAGPGLAARFARERALLGRLSHPGIARLLDAGEQDGRAFLVLEHVVGTTLSEHVRARGLGLNARVRLLLAVARAVEHAHAQLIVHRDLKPSNVMVHESGTTKLLDFGIAGLLDDSGAQTDHQLTQLAGRRLTPAYAAPEQIRGGAIGIAADVYSLGVMLYELASGHLPFGSASSSRTALEHAVLHTQAPRITRSATGAEADPPQNGPGRPADAARARGDLEAVAAKAMRKEPGERYASVGALILDLQRWLDQRPVSVRAEDWRHRTHLWMRRNAALVTAGALVLCALSVGLGVSLQQRHLAQQAASDAEAVSSFMTELLESASPDRHGGQPPSLLQLLESKRAELPTRFEGQPQVKDKVLATLTATYLGMNRFDIALPLAEQRLASAREHWGDDAPQTQDAQLGLARLLVIQDNSRQVIALLEPLLPKLRARLGPDDVQTVSARQVLLMAYAGRARFAESETLFQEERASARRRFKPDHYSYHYNAQYLFVLRSEQGRLTEAEQLMAELARHGHLANERQQRFVRVTDRNLAQVQWRLLMDDAQQAQARAVAAGQRMDALLGRGNDLHGSLLSALAEHLWQLDEPAAALAHLQRWQQDQRAVGAAPHSFGGVVREMAILAARARAGQALEAQEVEAGLQALNSQALVTSHRRAEGLLHLATASLYGLPAAQGQPLLARLLEALDAPGLITLPQWQARAEHVRALYAARQGSTQAALEAARRASRLLADLPEPQGLATYAAHLHLASALQAAGAPATEIQATLARADAARPARLDAAMAGRKHPLDQWRQQGVTGEPPPGF
ncbi:protein kinase domain-containing protein [Roseateles sp.]|uniref:serine/threonine-protein kinase n=1 Tax=Roseateles sp. TaxID=1971397 RepID=UPI00392B8BA4